MVKNLVTELQHGAFPTKGVSHKPVEEQHTAHFSEFAPKLQLNADVNADTYIDADLDHPASNHARKLSGGVSSSIPHHKTAPHL